MNPVTYFPVPTQHQYARNRELIRGKTYERYFNGDLWLSDEVLPALCGPMDRAAAIAPDERGLNSVLHPGYHAVENGFCELDDGIEQRSRYWLAHDITLHAFGGSLPLDDVAAALGLKSRLAGERVAYEQLLHDQIEFTHLSTFLAELHGEFA